MDIMNIESLSPNITGYRAADVINYLRATRGPLSTTEDRKRIGIIFEGGSLRGVISCCQALALCEFVNPSQFSHVSGSSSGALNSVYFCTSELEVAFSIYYDNATDKRCTNIWNYPNILNVDWLLDTYIFGEKRFSQSKLIYFPGEIFMSITDMSTGDARHYKVDKSDLVTLRKVMKATAYSPLLTNSYQIIDGNRYGDGASSDAIPYDFALNSGCEMVVCLLTRPPTFRRKPSWTRTLFEHFRLMGNEKAFLKTYYQRNLAYNDLLERLYVTGERCVPTLVIHPANDTEAPGNVGNSREIVKRQGEQAFERARKQLAELFTGTLLEERRSHP